MLLSVICFYSLIAANIFYDSSKCSAMYILCNEEPLWMSVCLKRANGQLQYRGSWKETTLYLYDLKSCCRLVPQDLKERFTNMQFLISHLPFSQCRENVPVKYIESGRSPLRFDGNLKLLICQYLKRPYHIHNAQHYMKFSLKC